MATSLLRKTEREKLSSSIGRTCVFELLYKATRDSCDATTFHRLCDNQGPTVTIMYNPEGSVYGGYVSLPWQSTTVNYVNDSSAFLFLLRRNGVTQWDKYGLKPDKHSKAFYCTPSYGPTFGEGHDLPSFTNDTLQKSSDCYTLGGALNFGNSYDMHGQDANDVFNGHQKVTDIEVYQVKGKTFPVKVA